MIIQLAQVRQRILGVRAEGPEHSFTVSPYELIAENVVILSEAQNLSIGTLDYFLTHFTLPRISETPHSKRNDFEKHRKWAKLACQAPNGPISLKAKER